MLQLGVISLRLRRRGETRPDACRASRSSRPTPRADQAELKEQGVDVDAELVGRGRNGAVALLLPRPGREPAHDRRRAVNRLHAGKPHRFPISKWGTTE